MPNKRGGFTKHRVRPSRQLSQGDVARNEVVANLRDLVHKAKHEGLVLPPEVEFNGVKYTAAELMKEAEKTLAAVQKVQQEREELNGIPDALVAAIETKVAQLTEWESAQNHPNTSALEARILARMQFEGEQMLDNLLGRTLSLVPARPGEVTHIPGVRIVHTPGGGSAKAAKRGMVELRSRLNNARARYATARHKLREWERFYDSHPKLPPDQLDAARSEAQAADLALAVAKRDFGA